MYGDSKHRVSLDANYRLSEIIVLSYRCGWYLFSFIFIVIKVMSHHVHKINVNYYYKNSSGDEIANVLVNDDIAHT